MTTGEAMIASNKSNERKDIYLYNTLTRQRERFVPRRAGEVSIYVCGVTPYDHAHIGHARPSIFFDVVRKFFTAQGWKVKFVQNFTDVDDKIIQRAQVEHMDPLELSKKYSDLYIDSMDRLNVQRADVYPKVSEHIGEIIDMISGLIQRDAAYVSGNDVYFRVNAFDDYGKLSRQRKEELVERGDVEGGEGKEDPLDFALWKGTKPGEPAWDSPWGQGRPGWHIECSAMSLKYLGHGFDIHGGGLDLIFPHHENEIAQSEAYTGEEPFVRYWLHNGLINFQDEKMSKSLGNFVTVDDLLDEYDPAFIRHAILQHHYRSPVDFSGEHMESMERGWRRLNDVYAQLNEGGEPLSIDEGEKAGGDGILLQAARDAEDKFFQALADDFNTPVALSALFDLARVVRPHLRSEGADEPTVVGLRAVTSVFHRLGDELLGVLSEEAAASASSGPTTSDEQLVNGLIDIIIEERNEARRRKEWDRADALRDALESLGISLVDTPKGTEWTLKS